MSDNITSDPDVPVKAFDVYQSGRFTDEDVTYYDFGGRPQFYQSTDGRYFTLCGLGGDCDELDVSPRSSLGHGAGVTPATRWEAPGGYTIPASAFAFHVDGPGFRNVTIADSGGRPLGDRWAPIMDAVRKSGARMAWTVKLPRGMDLHDATIPASARAVCTIGVPAEGWPPRWSPALGYTGWMDGPPDGVGVHKRRGARLPHTEPGRRAAWVLEGAR